MEYGELEALLGRLRAGVGAAEAHGWLCGALCTRGGFGAPDWLRELARDAEDGAGATAEELEPLHEQTRRALDSDGFEFRPLLPGDDAPLGERIESLAAWCNGFLYAVGEGGQSAAVGRSPDLNEFLGDLAEIARAELEPGRATEAGERDYAELVEFVRAGAQLAWVELAPGRGRRPGGATALH